MEKRGVSLKESEHFTQQKQARYMFRPTLSGVVFAFAQAQAGYGGTTGLAWVSDGLAAGVKKGIQVVPVVFKSGSFLLLLLLPCFLWCDDPRSGRG